ncbi:hypothetical protein CH35J_004695 [Colletotrichum higginsianum]|uniref:Uncharacterized protein n=1 Tax=Colletotrichum higginsianum TaxID=80884 RepID=A0A4T0WAX4_9PEZI|nr:hypothetical protein CH35J_004695 [Colletotrichum higginsianum]
MGILIFSVTLRNCPPASAAAPPGESSSQTRSTPSGQQAPPSPDNTDSELPEEQKAEEVPASGRGVPDQSTGGAMGTRPFINPSVSTSPFQPAAGLLTLIRSVLLYLAWIVS